MSAEHYYIAAEDDTAHVSADLSVEMNQVSLHTHHSAGSDLEVLLTPVQAFELGQWLISAGEELRLREGQ